MPAPSPLLAASDFIDLSIQMLEVGRHLGRLDRGDVLVGQVNGARTARRSSPVALASSAGAGRSWFCFA